jgi:hypothetical protein
MPNLKLGAQAQANVAADILTQETAPGSSCPLRAGFCRRWNLRSCAVLMISDGGAVLGASAAARANSYAASLSI